MQVGDLVKWRHPSETDVGVIAEVSHEVDHRDELSLGDIVKVLWSDGAYDWYEVDDIEVINENR